MKVYTSTRFGLWFQSRAQGLERELVAMLIAFALLLVWSAYGECTSSLPPPKSLSSSASAWPFSSPSGIDSAVIPDELILTVRETAGIARKAEVLRSGIPLPRGLNVVSTSALVVVDSKEAPVPAEFQILARWNAGKDDTSAPIQWLLVAFQASVAANSSATFRLITDGSAGQNPAPAKPLHLSRKGNQITVDTGAAVFTLGAHSDALFDKVLRSNKSGAVKVISGSELGAVANRKEVGHSATRRIIVEHSGPLFAIVVVEGAYDMKPVGEGGLGSMRRYVFTAGSSTAVIRHAVNWEGDLCGQGSLSCEINGKTQMNGVLMTSVRDELSLGFKAPFKVTAVGSRNGPAVVGKAKAGTSALVRQKLRKNRTAPLAFEVSVPGSKKKNGSKADGGVLAVSGSSGAVAVALSHMHRYEPQALRLLGNGRLAIDIAADKVWLGSRQGLFATMAVSALPANPSRGDLDRLVWAPLNRPLRAWASSAWFSASEATEEIPVGTLPEALKDYDSLSSSLLTNTLKQVDKKGLAGLMTFGVVPRLWGNPLYGDEIDCGDADPTPGEGWDNTYWCATWTDYHNTLAAAPTHAMRTGEVEWLDELGFPGALRTLHTQIMQCSPGDTSFYCGQAPAGYGGYRSDFNGSHAYFDNLLLYYWLTGDGTVVRTLQRGAESMRSYLCTRRPAEACQPNDPPTDEWAYLMGRVASQWNTVFRFLGLASSDSTFLEDLQANMARAVTQNYVQADHDGKSYGFMVYGASPLEGGPGNYSSDQLWLVSLYDMNVLYRLQRDTNDAPLGDPLLTPSSIIAAWSRTLTDYGSTASGDGTAQGTWPNALYFTWSGDRIGGTLEEVTADTSGDDPYIYDTGKSTLTAMLVRAGIQTGEGAILKMGADMTLFALEAAGNNPAPMGKEKGEFLSRLPAAIALLKESSYPFP